MATGTQQPQALPFAEKSKWLPVTASEGGTSSCQARDARSELISRVGFK